MRLDLIEKIEKKVKIGFEKKEDFFFKKIVNFRFRFAFVIIFLTFY